MGAFAFGALGASTKSVAIIGAVIVLTFYLGSKYVKKKTKKKTGYMSYPAKIYDDDTNIKKLKAKIISVIAVDAANKNQVAAVMDELVLLTENYGPRLQALIEERKTGLINHTGYLVKLRGIIDEIALAAGVEIVYKPAFIRKTS